MKIRVEMLAFGEDGEFREVEVPYDYINRGTDTQKMLALVYHYGQNDFQVRNHPSVSVGDVIHYAGEYWRIDAMGFSQLWETQLEEYREMEKSDRSLVSMRHQ